jgi:putative transcriptional regulator
MKNKLFEFRAKNNRITQQQLAEKVGCSRANISNIERELYIPSVKMALKMATVLNTKVEKLFKLESDEM